MSKTQRKHPPRMLSPKPRAQKERQRWEAVPPPPVEFPQRLEPVDWKPLG
jgi:hypothetical protein